MTDTQNLNQAVTNTEVAAGDTVPADGNAAYIAATISSDNPTTGFRYTIDAPKERAIIQTNEDFLKVVNDVEVKVSTSKQEQYADIFDYAFQNFDNFAFVQSDKNFKTSGTGLLTNNRNDVDVLWGNFILFTMIDPIPANQFYGSISKFAPAYQDKIKDSPFVTKAFQKLNKLMNYQLANNIWFGADFITAGVSTHYSGHKDVIANIKAQTAATALPTDLINGSRTNYFDLSGITGQTAKFQALDTLLELVSKTNKIFNYAPAGYEPMFTAEKTPIKIYANINWIKQLKWYDYNSYKTLKEYMDLGVIQMMPLSGETVQFNGDNTTTSPRAVEFAMHSGTGTDTATVKYTGLAEDEIYIYTPAMFIGRTWENVKVEQQEFTANNNTLTTRLADMFVSHVMPGFTAVIIKCPITLADTVVN